MATYDPRKDLPQKGSHQDREANGYLRSFPDWWIKPYHADAVAFFDMHPGDYFRRLEFLPGKDDDYTLVRVMPPALARDVLPATAFASTKGAPPAYYIQMLPLPPGMAARILAAVRREIDVAKPSGQKGNCRCLIEEDTGLNSYALIDGSSAIYLFAIRSPDGSYKLAEACMPRAYNPARLAALFDLLKKLSFAPAESAKTFA